MKRTRKQDREKGKQVDENTHDEEEMEEQENVGQSKSGKYAGTRSLSRLTTVIPSNRSRLLALHVARGHEIRPERASHLK